MPRAPKCRRVCLEPKCRRCETADADFSNENARVESAPELLGSFISLSKGSSHCLS